MTPSWVAAILDSKVTSLVGRVVLTFMYWSSGLSKLFDWNAGLGEMAHFHLNPPAAFNIATIIVQLGGSALVIWGRLAWLGAGALAVFTVLTIPIAHAFWTMSGPEKTGEFYTVMEHITVVGALIVVAVLAQREAAADAAPAKGAGLATSAAAS